MLNMTKDVGGGMTAALGYPPNIEKIRKVLPAVIGRPVLFCYGRTIYVSPGATFPRPSKVAHEAVHAARQGSDVEAWWDRYINDIEFRYAEELLAHVAEYLFLCEREPGRGARRKNLAMLSAALASPLYGRMTTAEAARQMLLDCAAAAKERAGD